MKYFTISELCKSSTAQSRGIDNTPQEDIVKKLTELIENVLDPVRELWGGPLIVNSGYRCPALNSSIKGAKKTSQHLLGEAADITTGKIGANKILFDMIRTSDIPFDQLIDESNYSWIHISYGERNRRQVLHL